ncbi:hypothetical protein [Mesorhizobium sp.]|uniref:hypothetical protein n=1 Tax=Mesorhizobium sp. TaxID=1871066 RepID=UPI000FE4C67B|nr:hypothetical protein [Mesorhizobium sp.]RWH32316.1 MAG: hypothetical protein EOQ76_03215 [Mesorhizobium sp.]RWH34357.1 MAG: hypothetical protein EOQ79_25565 [Mesorhizobium sp.]TIR57769.1 MAG: hypothetical protein E5X22_22305 [Mesorhizobium sp.]
MNRKARARIFWLEDRDDIAKLPEWLAWRSKHVTAAIEREHEDSGAGSICLFKHQDEAGLIRCATDELADLARDAIVKQLQIDVATDMGGEALARPRARTQPLAMHATGSLFSRPSRSDVVPLTRPLRDRIIKRWPGQRLSVRPQWVSE